MNDIHLIKTEKEYDSVMEEVLMLAKNNPAENSPEYDRMCILGLLIEEYDRKHYPLPESDPVEALKFRMEQLELRPVDMKPYFGSTNRYYDIINRKRPLSLSMIRKLHDGLGLPYESLLAV